MRAHINRVAFIAYVIMGLVYLQSSSAQPCIPGETCQGPFVGHFSNIACLVDPSTSYHQLIESKDSEIVPNTCRDLSGPTGARFQQYTCWNGELAIMTFQSSFGCVGAPTSVERYLTDTCVANEAQSSNMPTRATAQMYRCGGSQNEPNQSQGFTLQSSGNPQVDTSLTVKCDSVGNCRAPAFATLFSDQDCLHPMSSFNTMPVTAGINTNTKLDTCYSQLASGFSQGRNIQYQCSPSSFITTTYINSLCSDVVTSSSIILNKCLQYDQSSWIMYYCNP